MFSPEPFWAQIVTPIADDQPVCLDGKFSTTRLVTKTEVANVNHVAPHGGMPLVGGLRTRGWHKRSWVGKPLVSVITVVYNGDKFLSETITSVLLQSYDNVEYIVIDGGSTDDSLNLIRCNEDKIDLWISERDEGIYDAMNKGLRYSQGEIIGIVNSDDWYANNAIASVVSRFLSEPDLKLVYGAMNIWNANGQLDSVYGSKDGVSEIFSTPFNHPACFFHRAAYQQLGFYNQRFRTAADYDFMLRFKTARLKHAYVDEVLTNFRRVGVTSQSRMFPAVQIWNILRGNGYGLWACASAIVVRAIRVAVVSAFSRAGASSLKSKLRKYLKYHRNSPLS